MRPRIWLCMPGGPETTDNDILKDFEAIDFFTVHIPASCIATESSSSGKASR